MPFNSDKFECLRYGRNTALQNDTHYTSNSGCVIAVKDSLRDLGVTMSNDASFRRQIKNVVDSANKMCGWILRTFTTREPSLMLTLWRSMITLQIGLLQSALVPSPNWRCTGTRNGTKILCQKDFRFPTPELLGSTPEIEIVLPRMEMRVVHGGS